MAPPTTKYITVPRKIANRLRAFAYRNALGLVCRHSTNNAKEDQNAAGGFPTEQGEEGKFTPGI